MLNTNLLNTDWENMGNTLSTLFYKAKRILAYVISSFEAQKSHISSHHKDWIVAHA